MTYDGESRMTDFNGIAAYTYDGNGLRVAKSSSGAATVSIFSGSSVIAEYDNGAAASSPSREYIYNTAGGETTGLLAMFSGGDTTYYHQDQLSVRLTTDASGNIITQEGHFPFGEQWYAGPTNQWFFTNYDRDSESGLDYAMARYYGSGTGMFSSADPLTGSPGDPQSWNRYPYSRNNPISVTDPSGKSWSGFFKGLFMAAVDISIAASGDPAAVFMWTLDKEIISVGNGGQPMRISAGSMPLGTSFNGTPWGSTSQSALGTFNHGCEFGACGNSLTQGDGGPSTTSTIGSYTNDLFEFLVFTPQNRDLPLRLFGTHYCGPGGAGDATTHVDAACQAHDACYDAAHIDFGPNVGWGGWTKQQAAAARGCNQTLYNAVKQYPNEPGSKAIQNWLRYGGWLGILYPGTSAH